MSYFKMKVSFELLIFEETIQTTKIPLDNIIITYCQSI